MHGGEVVVVVMVVGRGNGVCACVKPLSRYILGLVSSVIRLFRALSGADREGRSHVPREGQPRLTAAAVKSTAVRRLGNKSLMSQLWGPAAAAATAAADSHTPIRHSLKGKPPY